MDKKLSRGDICLKKGDSLLTISGDELLQIDEDLYQIQITLEHKAWECPFCGESEQYYLVNDSVVVGCGGHSMQANGKQSDSCYNCMKKADEWHKSGGNKPTREGE